MSTHGRRPTRRRQKLADEVASIIEGRILDGTFAPGDRLPIEYELGEELNVSRTVVRDAIRALAARRLVSVRQGLGTVVTTPSLGGYAEAALTFLLRSDATLGDLWDARELLDTEMTAIAMRGGHADWSAAEQALEQFSTAVDHEDWPAASDAHVRFHVGLMTAMRNPIVDLLLSPMAQIISVTADAPRPTSDASDWLLNFALHPPILDAARRGDERALHAAFAAHYDYTQEPSYVAMRGDLLRESPAAHAVLRDAQVT